MPPKTGHRRVFAACLSCRTRKAKCDLGDADNPHGPPCARCKRERKECVFAKPIAAAGAPRQRQHKSQQQRQLSPQQQQPQQAHLTSRQPSITPSNSDPSMTFLAQVAGTIAKSDDRDRINAQDRIQRIERVASPYDSEPIMDSFGHAASQPNFSRQGSANKRPFSMPAPRSTLLIRPKPGSSLQDIDYIGHLLSIGEAKRLIRLFFLTMHPFYPYIPKEMHDEKVLAGYPMLLCTILAIATRYHTLPDILGHDDDSEDNDEHPQDHLHKRRHTMSMNEQKHMDPYAAGERNIYVHEQLWVYAQRLMSMTVWGESSSRSIGTLLSFLLFTEWNPRAIHFRWSDYANSGEDDDDQMPPRPIQSMGYGIDNTENSNNEDEYAGLSALKRSEIMSFMLIGTAVRLSFLLDDHPLIVLATNISESHTSIGLHKKSMLQQTLNEVDINDKRLLFTNYQKATIELLQFSSLCYETLYGTKPKFITLDKYQTLTILDILSPVLENWYKKYYKLLKPSHLHNVALNPKNSINGDSPSGVGNKFNPNWLEIDSNYPKLQKDLNTSIERESLILDYYYTKLYLYSLALSGDTSVSANLNSKKGRTLRLDELARYSRYVELAYKAAKEVLNVILRVKKLKMVKYIPVRWVTRVIKSVSFIVKCYLTLTTSHNVPKQQQQSQQQQQQHRSSASPTASPSNDESSRNSPAPDTAEDIDIDVDVTGSISSANDEILKLSVIPLEEIISFLQKVAICLRDSTPDELHLCTRYSTILMYLCSQFKSQMKSHSKKGEVRDYEEDYKSDNTAGTEANTTSATITTNNGNSSAANSNILSSTGELASGVGITGPGDGGIMNVGAQVGVTGTSLDINLNEANQELFDDLFRQNPSETLFNWFSQNDNNPGLDFVDQFTNEIERDLFGKNRTAPAAAGPAPGAPL